MALREIAAKQRGYLIVNSHPEGCAATVEQTWESIPAADGGDRRADGEGPVVLLLGASAGYGLAILLAGLRRHGIRGVGVGYEAPETERRTASAGWYRTAAAAALAERNGNDFRFVNADAFSDEARTTVLDLVAAEYGRVDYLIYSLAAPRRTDPRTGTTYTSVLKALGSPYDAPSLVFEDDTPRIGTVHLDVATDAEREATIQVMGGADWQEWVTAIRARDLAAPGFTTVALSYVGSEITAPVYRHGTIGAAKEHLEATATNLAGPSGTSGGQGAEPGAASEGERAFTAVAGAAVTQASTAIPSIALYTTLLRRALGPAAFRTPAQQAVALWDQLTGAAPLALDDRGRIRLDGWELDEDVQNAVRALWADPEASLAAAVEEAAWFLTEVRRLYGWSVPGIDYGRPVDTTVPWPVPQPSAATVG